ncbi:MAG: ABC-F type ribosomal protection protein [Syntrophomonadaceae bacterium]|nr:ABC-F type ribosomal protection protein [Syntrophomonadaceae bacterium]
MIELNVNGLNKYYGANKLFENISFEIKTGERIGLIGANGCGKTTIMKILMAMEEYQGGEISLRKGNKVGYLNQIPIYEKDTTTLDVLQIAFEQVHSLRKRMLELEQQMTHLEGESLEKAMNSYDRIMEQFELNHGYELEVRIDKITEGLQITGQMKEMLFDDLSGGEKTRVLLGKILLEEPDILLLDEPTNHLDLKTIEWLEGFLKEYKGAVLMVSHDRYFLDTVAGRILELSQDHMEGYPGNYSYYVVEKERRFLIEFRNYQNQQKKIERMEKQIERYRIWGAMRDSEVMYKRAKELEKRLEKVEVMKRPVLDARKIRLNQTAVGRSGKMVLEVKSLEKRYEDKELLSDVSFTLFYQDSACIIGDNGSGKTTLLKMLLGEEIPNDGTIRLGSQVKIGYLPQQVSYPDEELTVLEYFAGLHNLTNGAARSQLAKVLFMNEDVNKRIKVLSGGEKSRLRLCSLTFTGVNLLILDEPTNHLDVDSREVLEETLSEFDGTLLFVSHDRYFIEKLADRIIVIENTTTKTYEGNYLYYLEESAKEQQQKIAEQNQLPRKLPNQNLQTAATGKRGYQKVNTEMRSTTTNKSARKLEQVEKMIGELEEKLRLLEEQMELCNADSAQLTRLFEEQNVLKQELDTAYGEWEAWMS